MRSGFFGLCGSGGGGWTDIFWRESLVGDGVGVFRSGFLVGKRWPVQVGWGFCGGCGCVGSGSGSE